MVFVSFCLLRKELSGSRCKPTRGEDFVESVNTLKVESRSLDNANGLLLMRLACTPSFNLPE
jgi:hypothetical protein